MKINIKKLDRRYKGHGEFSHRAEFRGAWQPQDVHEKMKRFCEARNYLWNCFGPSAEVSWVQCVDPRPKWAWGVEDEVPHLYLNEEAYTTFVLIKDRWIQS